MPALIVSPTPATPLAAVGTFLLGWVLMAFTAQVAASFFLPDPPWRRAVVVGLAPAAVSMALIRFSPAVVILVGLAVDTVAFHLVYDARRRTTALMVVVHYATTVVLVLLLSNVAALLSTAPT